VPRWSACSNLRHVDDELQRSIGDEIRLRGGGVTCRKATWCWLGVAGSPTKRQRARVVARVLIFADQNSSYNGHYI
jgi:hypothetical protein